MQFSLYPSKLSSATKPLSAATRDFSFRVHGSKTQAKHSNTTQVHNAEGYQIMYSSQMMGHCISGGDLGIWRPPPSMIKKFLGWLELI